MVRWFVVLRAACYFLPSIASFYLSCRKRLSLCFYQRALCSLQADLHNNCHNASKHSHGDTNIPSQSSNHVHSSSASKSSSNVAKRKVNIWIEFWHIMYRSPTLRLLYLEAIFHQLVANLLNVMFHDALRLDLPNNSSRAVLVGFLHKSLHGSSKLFA